MRPVPKLFRFILSAFQLLANQWNRGWGDVSLWQIPNLPTNSLKFSIMCWTIGNAPQDGYFKIIRGRNECGIEEDVVAGMPSTKNMVRNYGGSFGTAVVWSVPYCPRPEILSDRMAMYLYCWMLMNFCKVALMVYVLYTSTLARLALAGCWDGNFCSETFTTVVAVPF